MLAIAGNSNQILAAVAKEGDARAGVVIQTILKFDIAGKTRSKVLRMEASRGERCKRSSKQCQVYAGIHSVSLLIECNEQISGAVLGIEEMCGVIADTATRRTADAFRNPGPA